jgi:hypothetical protein
MRVLINFKELFMKRHEFITIGTLILICVFGLSMVSCNMEPGAPGPQGEQGLQGEKGQQGEKGADGTDGGDDTSSTLKTCWEIHDQANNLIGYSSYKITNPRYDADLPGMQLLTASSNQFQYFSLNNYTCTMDFNGIISSNSTSIYFTGLDGTGTAYFRFPSNYIIILNKYLFCVNQVDIYTNVNNGLQTPYLGQVTYNSYCNTDGAIVNATGEMNDSTNSAYPLVKISRNAAGIPDNISLPLKFED